MASVLPGERIWSELQPVLAATHAVQPVVVSQAELGPDEGGPPLSRIVAFPATEPSPHWHVVTCGLSASRVIAGYPDLGGLELSLRLARPANQTAPPTWIAPLLQALGRDAFADDRPVGVGEKVNLEPLLEAHDTAVTAGIYVEDPVSAGAPIRLVQLVVLTPAERSRVERSAIDQARLVFEIAPLGISDLGRHPRPRAQAPAPRPAPEAPPSPPLGSVTVQKFDGRMRLSIAANEAAGLGQVLLYAIRAGKVSLSCREWTIHISVDDVPRSATWATTLAIFFTIDLAKQAAAELADPARTGQPLRWSALPDLELLVVGAPQASLPAPAQPTDAPTLGSWIKGLFGRK